MYGTPDLHSLHIYCTLLSTEKIQRMKRASYILSLREGDLECWLAFDSSYWSKQNGVVIRWNTNEVLYNGIVLKLGGKRFCCIRFFVVPIPNIQFSVWTFFGRMQKEKLELIALTLIIKNVLLSRILVTQPSKFNFVRSENRKRKTTIRLLQSCVWCQRWWTTQFHNNDGIETPFLSIDCCSYTNRTQPNHLRAPVKVYVWLSDAGW